MRLEQLTVRLRARSAWEAVELGMALVRRHAAAIWKPWLLVTLPVFALLNAAAWALDLFWLAALLMWWLKPVFDRIPLYVVSRAVFGSVPGVRETLQAQRRWGWAPMPHYLSWRRFSPVRSLYLPVDLLEGVGGERMRQRRSVLGGMAYGNAALLTLVCLHFESALVLGCVVAVMMYLPVSYLPDSFQAAWALIGEQPAAWMKLAWNAFLWLATSIVEPFFVGAGFGLYLNRRTQIEAWDVEIAFRKLRARLAAAASPLLLLVLLAGPTNTVWAQERDVPPPSSSTTENSEENEPPIAPTLPQVFGEQRVDDQRFRKAADKAYQDPLLRGKRTQTTWERKDAKKEEEPKRSDLPEWLQGIIGFFALLGEWALWLVALVLVVVLLATMRYWLPWMRGGYKRRAARHADVETEALLVPELLPDNVPAAARRLWREGKPRHALALLYRASVESMSTRINAVLPPGATEAECLRASRRMPDADDRSAFARIVRVWQYAAYAQRLPAEEEFEALIAQLQQRYGWAA
ncbi:DUF4129 domain-containing protein [Pseudoxanthomonas sp. UTMC 1351]|uniref:DUF4129 domain-containing protein n=1 Tax=Pseudoxanthomonas sp. UTMC 1351 TaxID=2695853 RepID=UPI0034CFD5E0